MAICKYDYFANYFRSKSRKMNLETLLTAKLRIRNVYIREGLAEFLGTFILIVRNELHLI